MDFDDLDLEKMKREDEALCAQVTARLDLRMEVGTAQAGVCGSMAELVMARMGRGSHPRTASIRQYREACRSVLQEVRALNGAIDNLRKLQRKEPVEVDSKLIGDASAVAMQYRNEVPLTARLGLWFLVW